MRVVVSLRAFFPGKIGGLETYVRELLNQWGGHWREDEWIVLLNPESAGEFTSPGPHLRFEVAGPAGEMGAWRAAIAEKRPDVLFSPLLAVDPIDAGVGAVFTIPDLQHLIYAEFFSPEIRLQRHVNMTISLRRGHHAVTLSEYARQTILDRMDAPADRVHAIPLAAGDDFRRAVAPAAAEAFRVKHGLPLGFGYYPANCWPHKNHETLFQALRLYRKRHGAPPPVALSGFGGDDSRDIRAALARHGVERDVVLLGYLDRAELPVAYAAAGFLVFPSLFEGFGMPVADAMAAGCPVLCSSAASLPEVAGEAALFFDPENPVELATQLRRFVSDAELRTELVRRGRQRSEALTWRTTAAKTREVLRRVAERRTGVPAPALVTLPVTAGGRCVVPAGVDEGSAVLHFLRPGSSVAEPARDQALRFFREGTVDAALGPIQTTAEPASLSLPEADIWRLKSKHYIPLESWWIGPRLAPAVLGLLRRRPAAHAYEIALAVASAGTVGSLPEAVTRTALPDPGMLRTLHGAKLSYQCFGVIDESWLERCGEGVKKRLGWPGRRTRLGELARAAAVALCTRWISGRFPAGWRARLRDALLTSPDPGPHADGWIGRRARVICHPAGDHRLQLAFDSPVWPLPQPPRIRVWWGRRLLYEAPLLQRGGYTLDWTWPAAAAETTLRIEVDRGFVPARLGLGEDQRELSVRILQS